MPTKQHYSVVTIGHCQHGKTSLTSAITKVLAEDNLGTYVTIDQIDHLPEERENRRSISNMHVEYETNNRHYYHVDCPGCGDHLGPVIAGLLQADGAVLVVDVLNGTMPQTALHIGLAGRLGVKRVIVFLNKCDYLDDDDQMRLEVMEDDVRGVLSYYGFPGDEIPVVRGSALAALNRSNDDLGRIAIQKLLKTFDQYIEKSSRPMEGPFLMTIDNVLDTSIITGRVERGLIKIGDEVEIVGLKPTMTTTVSSIQLFGRSSEQAKTGDIIECVLRDVGPEEISPRQVVCEPNSLSDLVGRWHKHLG